MAVKASVDTQNQTTVRVGQQNAIRVSSTAAGISGADTATTAVNVVGGRADVTQLAVSGLSTFTGVGRFISDLYVGGDLYLTDDLVLDNISGNSLDISGISSVGFITATDVHVSGAVTATKFYGDGSNLTNTGAVLSDASGSQRLIVSSLSSGIMTTAATDGDLTWDSSTNTLSATNVSIAGTLTYEDVTNVDSVGIITAGNGLRVTEGGLVVSAGFSTVGFLTANSLYVSGIATFASGNLLIEANGTNTHITESGDGNLFIKADDLNFNNAAGTLFLGAFNSTGLIIPDTITHNGDPNTKIRFPDNDNISFETAGIEALRIAEDQKVGIGTDNPAYTLDLGESSSTIRLVSENNGTALRIGAGGGSNDFTLIRVDGATVAHGETDDSAYGFSLKYMGARTGNNNSFSLFSDNITGTQFEAITVLQDGKIGIGTITPQAKLDVVGTLSISGVSTFAGTLDANGDVDLGASASNTITFHGDVDSAIIPNADNIRALGANGERWSTLWVNQNNSSLLSVTGISTFAGITTVTGDTLFTKQLSVSGLSTYIGISTYKDDVFIDGTLTAGAIDGGTY